MNPREYSGMIQMGSRVGQNRDYQVNVRVPKSYPPVVAIVRGHLLNE